MHTWPPGRGPGTRDTRVPCQPRLGTTTTTTATVLVLIVLLQNLMIMGIHIAIMAMATCPTVQLLVASAGGYGEWFQPERRNCRPGCKPVFR
eukprot:3651034-Rhodomonas_salina.1